MTTIHRDIVTEARELIQAATAAGVPLRLLGGLAIRLHSPSATHRALTRGYLDIDLATPSKSGRATEQLLASRGYTPDRSFNLLNGATRLLFHDQERSRQIDVFIGQFEMCHHLPICERLDCDPLTLPLAELLLTKLQIVQINDKDVRDICALLLDHPTGTGDEEMINLERIAHLCAADWGLWKTVTLSLETVDARIADYTLDEQSASLISQRIDTIRQALDQASKPLAWRMRAAIGERVRWYELPEEVQRG